MVSISWNPNGHAITGCYIFQIKLAIGIYIWWKIWVTLSHQEMSCSKMQKLVDHRGNLDVALSHHTLHLRILLSFCTQGLESNLWFVFKIFTRWKLGFDFSLNFMDASWYFLLSFFQVQSKGKPLDSAVLENNVKLRPKKTVTMISIVSGQMHMFWRGNFLPALVWCFEWRCRVSSWILIFIPFTFNGPLVMV